MNILERVKVKKMSQEDKILWVLRKKNKYGAEAVDFINMGIFKYSSRISDLRKEGYIINAIRIKGSLWKYYLEDTKNV